MNRPHAAPLPPDSLLTTVVRDYQPAPPALPDTLAPLLATLEVSEVTAIRYRCTPAWSIPTRRIGDDMLFAVLAGHGEMTVDGRRQALAPGVIAHWRRDLPHAASQRNDQPLDVIALHYTATVAGGHHLAALLGFPDAFALPLAHPAFAALGAACRDYCLRPPGWQPGLEALALRLLLDLAQEHVGALRPSAPAALRASRALAPALSALARDLAAPQSMAALARRCAVSPAQFRRLFHAAFACGPRAWRQRQRLHAACRLLRAGDLTVAAVAERVGYREPAAFAHAFRRFTGTSPGRWREAP